MESQRKDRADDRESESIKKKQTNQKRKIDGREKYEPLAKRLRKLARVDGTVTMNNGFQNTVCLELELCIFFNIRIVLYTLFQTVVSDEATSVSLKRQRQTIAKSSHGQLESRKNDDSNGRSGSASELRKKRNRILNTSSSDEDTVAMNNGVQNKVCLGLNF